MAGRVISTGGWIGGTPTVPVTAKRNKAYYDALNIKGENFDRQSAITTLTTVSTRMYASLLGFVEGDVITNVIVGNLGVGASLTLVKAGVYATDGTLLASSADVKAASATGAWVIPLSSAYTVPDDTGLYLAFLCTATGSGVVVAVSAGANSTFAAISGGSIPYVNQTGPTDLPSTATFTASGNCIWFGWS